MSTDVPDYEPLSVPGSTSEPAVTDPFVFLNLEDWLGEFESARILVLPLSDLP